MKYRTLEPLRIGALEIPFPVIQGGMGVRVSGAKLAASVANTGCAGTIASVGLGKFEDLPGSEFIHINDEALANEISKAQHISKGVIGINIMVALTNYANLVQIAIQKNVDFISIGAGLPLDLPKYTSGSSTKLIPIISSAKSGHIILRKWKKRYNQVPDAFIVEGPMAGGHLGFKFQDLQENRAPNLANLVKDVVRMAAESGHRIPVIAAGGIFDGKDIVHMIKLGASGVQMGTRFVCTKECDAHENFKQTYVQAEKKDVTLIQSPVGLPGRVIKNRFTEMILRGEKLNNKCKFHCLKTCIPKEVQYCIAKVLAKAAGGHLEDSFVFAGENAYKCTEIISVQSLVNRLKEEVAAELN